jgi:alkanesulfonate monooxygenase SsuD/methylene tetrahydromethanopterin reductase-like flavin-dependent oxidoreductase (luciferase family)
MTRFNGDIGVQFTIHIANQYRVPELVTLADRAHEYGFDQVWVNDNLGSRNVFVVLSAIAANTDVDVGTAITVPYYRNPVDLADTVAALSELVEGEVSLGLGRGSLSQTGQQVKTPQPYAVLRETAQCLQRLLAGEEILFGDYPCLCSYFNMQPETSLEMGFLPSAQVRTYIGGHGPTALTVGGKFMDGLVLGGYVIPLIATGKLEERLIIADDAAAEANRDRPRRVAEINTSIARDKAAALEFPKPYVSHLLIGLKRLGFDDEEFESMNINPNQVIAIESAFEDGATIHEAADLVTDEMVEATFIVGTPNECRDQFRDIVSTTNEIGIDQFVLAKLGPDYTESLELLHKDVLQVFQ